MHWSYFSNWLENVTHGEFLGIKFDRIAAEQQIRKLVSSKESSGAKIDFAIAALSRAERVLPAISGARILWIDPAPANNAQERGVLEEMGIIVQLALSTEDADKMIQSGKYDLIISNVRREDSNLKYNKPLKNCPVQYVDFPTEALRNEYKADIARFNQKQLIYPQSGFAMLEYFFQSFPEEFGDREVTRAIFYTASNGGIVSDACARIVTNRPDVLLQTVVSVLEELRWRKLKTNDPPNK